MNSDDRARIARQYGVDPDTIPEPQTIPSGVSGWKEAGLAERTKAAFSRHHLGRRLAVADRRNGEGKQGDGR